jgi:4'-phosphopantetheinyl transferase EntD
MLYGRILFTFKESVYKAIRFNILCFTQLTVFIVSCVEETFLTRNTNDSKVFIFFTFEA